MKEDEISVKELILGFQGWVRYLLSKWRIIFIAGILGGLFGLGYAFWKKPAYTAITTFVLEGGDSKTNLSQYAGMAAMVGIDLGGGNGLFQGDNILELYKSRTMLAQTLLSNVHSDSSELLIERYIDYNKLKSGWEDDPELISLDFRQDSSELTSQQLRVRDSIITAFAKVINENILKVNKLNDKLSIIQVSVTSPDEVFSKAFNENLVRRVNDFYVQTKTKKSAANISILQAKVDSVRAVMAGAIYSAAKASDATPNLNPTRQVKRIAPAQEAQFSAEANKEMLGQLLQNLELTKMSLLREQPLIQLVDQPVYPLKVDRVGKAMGMVIGGMIFGLLAIIMLVLSKYYQDVMKEE
ncbi:lipopolysaccharide biosynthesis protein [Parapedobacter sp. GCM10030251]|uniref:lipopolysaccharide biosynthesis protein n=1 Tax=Parapedobacter sp. GCM10030251 TaxID=3273419 RepID=UPI0036208764